MRKVARSLFILTMSLCVTACTGADESAEMSKATVRGVTYSFPPDHVRVNDITDRLFHVVVYPFENARGRKTPDTVTLTLSDKNYRGLAKPVRLPDGVALADIPVVAHISDGPIGTYDVVQTKIGPAVCSTGRHLTDCGFSIIDADLKWSVTFDRSRLSKVLEIKTGAEKALRSYRQAS